MGMDFRFLLAPSLWTGTIAAASFLYPTDALKLGHSFSVAMNFGMTAYVTCVAGPIMFRTLPRQQFATVQGMLFPIYFAFQSLSSLIVALSMHKYSNNVAQNRVSYSLLLLSMFQTIILSPKTQSTMEVFMKLRKEEGEDSNTEKFKKAKGAFYACHGISSLCNIASFLLQSVHIYWLCQSGKYSL
eukprot:674007_1